MMAIPGRLTVGQQSQLVLSCSDHPVGFCETCQRDLSLADLFASFLGHFPHLCPWCGTDVASSLHRHISMCRFIADGVTDTARDNEDAARKTLNDTETGARPEYMLVTQPMTSRSGPRGHLRRLTIRVLACGVSAVVATFVMLAWVTPMQEFSSPKSDVQPDPRDSGASAARASARALALTMAPNGNEAQPGAENQTRGITAPHQRVEANASSGQATQPAARTVVSPVMDRRDGPEDAQSLPHSGSLASLPRETVRTGQIRPVAVFSRALPGAPLVMTSGSPAGDARTTACSSAEGLPSDLRWACHHVQRFTHAIEGIGEAAERGAANVMTSITHAMTQMPIDGLRPERVKQFFDDLPGAPDALRPAAMPERSESP